MTMQSKIFATCRMYLKAIEEKNEERKQIFAERANTLYRETFGTEYEHHSIREYILFCMAMGESGYYFKEDLRKLLKSMSAQPSGRL